MIFFFHNSMPWLSEAVGHPHHLAVRGAAGDRMTCEKVSPFLCLLSVTFCTVVIDMRRNSFSVLRKRWSFTCNLTSSLGDFSFRKTEIGRSPGFSKGGMGVKN